LRQSRPFADFAAPESRSTVEDILMRLTDYDPIAPVFDRRYRDENYTETETALRTFLTSRNPIQVLDVGCGTGYWLRLSTNQTRMIGLDASAEMLTRSQSKSAAFNLVRACAEALPFPDESFDRVLCVNSFHHFADKPLFISEARRVLRPGGGFMTISLDPHTGLDRWWVYDYFENTLKLDQQRYLSAPSTREMLTAAGFADCHTHLIQCFLGVLAARQAIECGAVAKTVTSQLAILSDAEYERGLARIREDIELAEDRLQELLLVFNLRLFATTAWVK
jgi:ubiquinone/menaquinone biosynthesis C-methylase UbiE